MLSTRDRPSNEVMRMAQDLATYTQDDGNLSPVGGRVL